MRGTQAGSFPDKGSHFLLYGGVSSRLAFLKGDHPVNRYSRYVGRAFGAAILIASSVIAFQSAYSQSTENQDWPVIGGTLGNIRYSTLTQINVQNVNQLGGAWKSPKF